MLAPFAPFTCEELWSQTSEKGFISLAPWPAFDEAKVNIAAEEQENLVIDVMSDTANILKAMKISPKQIYYYTAAPWKLQIYLKILEKTIAGEAKINELMKEFSFDKDLKPRMKDIAGLVPKVIRGLTKLPSERKTNILKIRTVDENAILQSAQAFFKERFNTEVTIYNENDKNRYDPKNRSAMALPLQPAIYIE
jgi:leucyl-tRNA synthetase